MANNNNLIFTSLGNRQKILKTLCEAGLPDRFDLISFFYGDSEDVFKQAAGLSRVIERGKRSKFQALKSMWMRHRSAFSEYDAIWVCDADLILESGNPELLADSLFRFNLKVIGPAQSRKGKVFWDVQLPVDGPHTLRLVNFVEMGFPMFTFPALDQFMNAYNGELTGWGMDWWYLNVFESDKKTTAAIHDKVVIMNPSEQPREIDTLKAPLARHDEWLRTKDSMGLREWQVRNLHFVF